MICPFILTFIIINIRLIFYSLESRGIRSPRVHRQKGKECQPRLIKNHLILRRRLCLFTWLASDVGR